MPAGDERVLRRRHAVARAGRRAGAVCSPRSRWRRGAEVTVECNPDDVTADADADVRRRRREPAVSFGVQSMVPHVLAALGRTHDPANVERAVAAVRDAGVPTFNLDLIYGAAGESLDDWRTHRRGGARPRAAARVGLRAHVEAGHAARRASPTATPTTTTRPTSTSSPTTLLAGRRAARTTRSRTGPAPGTSAGTTCSTGARATTAGSAAPPTRTGTAAAGGTCARPSATSSWCAPAARPRRRARRSTTTTPRFERLQLVLRMRDGVPLEALDGEALRRPGGRDGDRWVLTRRGRLMANAVSLRSALMPANSSGNTRATLAVR